MNKREVRRVFFRINNKESEEKLELMCFLTSKSIQDIMEFCINVGFEKIVNEDPEISKKVNLITKMIKKEKEKTC